MKNLTLKISLVLFFSMVLLSAFGQSKPITPSKPGTAIQDTANKVKADPGGKKNNPDTPKTDTPVKAKKTADTSGSSALVGKTFIFNQNFRIKESNSAGEKNVTATNPVAIRGTRFYVTKVENGDALIVFYIWGLKKSTQKYAGLIKDLTKGGIVDFKNINEDQKKDFEANEKDIFERIDAIAKRKTFNFKQYADEQFTGSTLKLDSEYDNRYFFLLAVDSLKKYCSEYKDEKKWDINFGTLVTPFKLRFNRFSATNNLSVGGAVYFQKKFDADWSWGSVLALSLSSVTLDAASTNIHQNASNTNPPLKASTTRPAFSPSIHGVISYKNINFTLGIGFDYISKPTDIATATNPEAGWIYNGKPWLGLGLGISLFSNSSSATKATTPLPGQTKGQ